MIANLSRVYTFEDDLTEISRSEFFSDRHLCVCVMESMDRWLGSRLSGWTAQLQQMRNVKWAWGCLKCECHIDEGFEIGQGVSTLRRLESNDFCLICSEEVRVCDFEMSELLPPQIRRPSRVRMRLRGLPRQLQIDNQWWSMQGIFEHFKSLRLLLNTTI